MEVKLHVYDVTNSVSDKTNNTILQINRIFKDGIGVGGIFHSAIQVYGEEEWSFGFCENGSGVFSCPPTKNPMYTYRECISLGETNLSSFKVVQILRELSREWPGNSYDLLAKNCNHFCDVLCDRLEVSKLPGWVNRFANVGDTAVEVAGFTSQKFRQAKDEVVTASKVAYRFLAGIAANNNSATTSSGTQVLNHPTVLATAVLLKYLQQMAKTFYNQIIIVLKPPTPSKILLICFPSVFIALYDIQLFES